MYTSIPNVWSAYISKKLLMNYLPGEVLLNCTIVSILNRYLEVKHNIIVCEKNF